MRAPPIVVITIATLQIPSPATAADGSQGGTLVEKFNGKIDARTIEELLVDSAAVTVPAANLAGVDADLMNNIENVRDFSMVLSAFDKNAQGAGLALTPARTTMPFPAINLRDYAQPGAHVLRLLGSLTLSYAKGKTGVVPNAVERGRMTAPHS